MDRTQDIKKGMLFYPEGKQTGMESYTTETIFAYYESEVVFGPIHYQY